MVEIYRIEKGAETWKYKAYDYVRTDAFCVGQSIPIELEFSHDEKEEDLQAVILIEDHKPVAGCRIAFPDEKTGKIERVCVVREKQKGGYGRILIQEAENWLKEYGVNHIVISSQDVSLVFTSIPELLGKLPITLELAVLSMLLGLILGLVMAIIKMHKIKVLTQLTNLLISLLRGTPVIVQLYVAFFGIPMFFKAINQKFGTNLAVADIPGIAYAMIALGLNQAGFMAEIIRSALQSVDNGQIEAAHALGMTYPQALRRIILPEAFEVALPTLGNALISIIKGTSLAFTCAVVEITAQGQIIAGKTYRYFEVYVSLAIIYWVITLIIEQLIRIIENKIRIPDQVELVNFAEEDATHDKN